MRTSPSWRKIRDRAIARGDCGRCAKRSAVDGNYCSDCRAQAKKRRAEYEMRERAKAILPGIFRHFAVSVSVETRNLLCSITDAAVIERAGKMFLRWWLPSVKNGCPISDYEINRVIAESLEVVKADANDPYYQRCEFHAQAVQSYPQYHGVDGYL